jgi:iron complex transport system substrate-binding protein
MIGVFTHFRSLTIFSRNEPLIKSVSPLRCGYGLRCVVMVLLCAQCASFANADSPIKNAPIADTLKTDIVVTDYLQREVRLPKPAQRIVALAPHIVENIYSAGAGEFLVGAVDYCDYPEAAKKIPRVGAISAYSLEAIVAQKPDLVVVWMSTRGGDVLKKIEDLGIPTYASDPRTLADVAKSIRDYGVLAGTQAHAEKTARDYEQHLQKLTAQYQHAKPVSVLYEVWYEPLQTINNNHIISDVIRLCGGVNSFGDAPVLAPKISIESVIARNPEVIVASGMGEARPDWLDNWRKWPALQAVQKEHLYFIPPDFIQRHTARILQGAEMMCTHLDRARPKTNNHGDE